MTCLTITDLRELLTVVPRLTTVRTLGLSRNTELWATDVYGARLDWCVDSDAHTTKIPDTRFPAVPNRGELTAVDWCTAQRRTLGNRLLPQQAIRALQLLEDLLGRQGIR